MSAASLLHQVEAAGLRLKLTETGTIKVAGPDAELARWTPIIRQHKPELIDLLRAWRDLEMAVAECCRVRGDTRENRAALIADCWREPADSWPGWRSYFESEISRWTH